MNTDNSALEQPFGVTVTPIDYILEKINKQYQLLWTITDFSEALSLNSYPVVQDKYLRELISLSMQDNGTMILRAIGQTSLQSQELADAVFNYLSSKSTSISKDCYAHQINVIDKMTKNVIDQETIERQDSAYSAVEIYKGQISDIDIQLSELVPPSAANASMQRKIAVFTIYGMLAGLLFICFIGTAEYLTGMLDSSHQIVRCLNITLLGHLPSKRTFFDRIADGILNEQVWDDCNSALAYISEKTTLQCDNRSSILLLSSLPIDSNKTQGIRHAIEHSCPQVRFESDYYHNPMAMQALRESDSVIFVETLRKSKLDDLIFMKDYINQLHKPIDGFILI